MPHLGTCISNASGPVVAPSLCSGHKSLGPWVLLVTLTILSRVCLYTLSQLLSVHHTLGNLTESCSAVPNLFSRPSEERGRYGSHCVRMHVNFTTFWEFCSMSIYLRMFYVMVVYYKHYNVKNVGMTAPRVEKQVKYICSKTMRAHHKCM